MPLSLKYSHAQWQKKLFYSFLDGTQILISRWFSLLPFQFLKGQKDPLMEGVLRETENMLARGRMDLPLTLCFAAIRGDDLLLHQLLKRGLDPNESDNNRRSALV